MKKFLINLVPLLGGLLLIILGFFVIRQGTQKKSYRIQLEKAPVYPFEQSRVPAAGELVILKGEAVFSREPEQVSWGEFIFQGRYLAWELYREEVVESESTDSEGDTIVHYNWESPGTLIARQDCRVSIQGYWTQLLGIRQLFIPQMVRTFHFSRTGWFFKERKGRPAASKQAYEDGEYLITLRAIELPPLESELLLAGGLASGSAEIVPYPFDEKKQILLLGWSSPVRLKPGLFWLDLQHKGIIILCGALFAAIGMFFLMALLLDRLSLEGAFSRLVRLPLPFFCTAAFFLLGLLLVLDLFLLPDLGLYLTAGWCLVLFVLVGIARCID